MEVLNLCISDSFRSPLKDIILPNDFSHLVRIRREDQVGLYKEI